MVFLPPSALKLIHLPWPRCLPWFMHPAPIISIHSLDSPNHTLSLSHTHINTHHPSLAEFPTLKYASHVRGRYKVSALSCSKHLSGKKQAEVVEKCLQALVLPLESMRVPSQSPWLPISLKPEAHGGTEIPASSCCPEQFLTFFGLETYRKQ